jgi:hypothetical protein
MEPGQRQVSMEDVYGDVHAIVTVLERADETTWSRRIGHTLTGSTVEEVFPPLRHELCGLRRAPVARVLGLEQRLDALVAALNDALAPYGYRPQRCGEARAADAVHALASDHRAGDYSQR